MWPQLSLAATFRCSIVELFAMPTEDQILERMPVWNALAEFFLDTELSAADLKRIASVLARSKYTEEELHEILRHEVYPACSPNLTQPAGEWAGWDEDWIREVVAPRYDHRPALIFPAFQWKSIHTLWQQVKKEITDDRSQSG